MDFLKDAEKVDLCGEWRLAYGEDVVGEIRCGEDIDKSGLEILPATVPGNFEIDMERAGKIGDPFFGMNTLEMRRFEKTHMVYSRTFKAEDREGMDSLLRLEGVDCYSEVYLNGEHIGSTDNMLIEHVFDVTGKLKDDNELVVHIRPATEEAKKYECSPGDITHQWGYDSLNVRKAPHMYGWDIMPRIVSGGLWKPVRIIYRPREHLKTVLMSSSFDTDGHAIGKSRVDLQLYFDANIHGRYEDEYEVRFEGRCGDSTFAGGNRVICGAGNVQCVLENPKLWWPRGRGEQSLYDVTAYLLKNGEVVDSLSFRHGIRSVELERTSTTDEFGNGEFVFWVNGEKVFMKGSNWVPLDALHSRDIERVDRAIDLVVETGSNMLRCWGGNVYESDRFYDLCDENGILVWQDFALACALYPQDGSFRDRLEREATLVIRRLRQHPSIVMWAGDNECDGACYWWGISPDPNDNTLTRKLLPSVIRREDTGRPYIPSSPYIDEEAYAKGGRYVTPEDHLWGPRDYFKGDFYRQATCHFVSEIGYHGCANPESMEKFISSDKLWPWQDNPEWLLHSTCPVPEMKVCDGRVKLMANQIREMFRDIPDDLNGFAFASQAVQAEAKKFFIEMFRSEKWRRTGILWWNILDGWPQLSDAVVDYYWGKKLAFHFIKTAQKDLCVMLREPHSFGQDLVVCNDTRNDIDLSYTVRDIDTGELVAQGSKTAVADDVTDLQSIPFFSGDKKFYVIEWTAGEYSGTNHYLAGHPPFDLDTYCGWVEKAGLLDGTYWAKK